PLAKRSGSRSGCTSYSSAPSAERVRSVMTGLASFAARSPTAVSILPPGRTYSVAPRARSVSRSSRYVLTSKPSPKEKTRNAPRRWSAASAIFSGLCSPTVGSPSVRNTTTPRAPSAGGWLNASSRAPAIGCQRGPLGAVAPHAVGERDEAEAVPGAQRAEHLDQGGLRLGDLLARHRAGDVEHGHDVAMQRRGVGRRARREQQHEIAV